MAASTAEIVDFPSVVCASFACNGEAKVGFTGIAAARKHDVAEAAVVIELPTADEKPAPARWPEMSDSTQAKRSRGKHPTTLWRWLAR